MNEMVMTPALPIEHPTIRFQDIDDLARLHLKSKRKSSQA